jgi:hypothetical protein
VLESQAFSVRFGSFTCCSPRHVGCMTSTVIRTQAKTRGEERWVRSMVNMRLSDAQTQRLLVLREQTVEELSNLYKFRQMLAKHGMQLSESLLEFVKSVSGTGIMPEVWQVRQNPPRALSLHLTLHYTLPHAGELDGLV